MLWCCESIKSDPLCRLGDLICGDEWNFDSASEARFDRTIGNHCQKLYAVIVFLVLLWIDRVILTMLELSESKCDESSQ